MNREAHELLKIAKSISSSELEVEQRNKTVLFLKVVLIDMNYKPVLYIRKDLDRAVRLLKSADYKLLNLIQNRVREFGNIVYKDGVLQQEIILSDDMSRESFLDLKSKIER